jgi:uncharacterized protein
MNTRSRWLLRQAFLIEGGLFSVALIWAWWQQIPWRQALMPTLSAIGIGAGAGIGLLAINYGVVRYGAHWLPFFRIIKELLETDLAPLFKRLSPGAIIGIALLSGIAEECFFRGVLQWQFGLLGASLIFGVAHIWRSKAIVYGLYAALIGLGFGTLYVITGNLWAPIVAHVVNNFGALWYYTSHTFHASRLRGPLDREA